MFNAAPVLYRQAMAASRKAADIASGSCPVTANPAARIADACIVAIVLGHAAVETAWFHAQSEAGLAALDWPRDFVKGLDQAAKALGRGPLPPLPVGLQQRFERVAAWRNYLVHGDARSTAALGAGEDAPDPSDLTAGLAAEAVAVSREALHYIAHATGQDLGMTNWIDPLE
jgi:hypothetical protein